VTARELIPPAAISSRGEFAAAPETARRQRAGVIALALARVEGPRLVRHPAFLAGAGLSVLISALMVRDNLGGAYQALMGTGGIPLAAGTLLAVNLAALRSTRSDTDELFRPLPAPPAARTLAHLLSIAWAVAGAVLLVAAGFLALDAGDGLRVTPRGATAVPSVFELAQGPAAVGVLGAVGLVLARWVPHLAAGAVAVVAMLAGNLLVTSWNLHAGPAWLAPVVSTARPAPGSSWPCYFASADPACGQLLGFETAAAGWHLVYLAGLLVLLGAVALLPEARRQTVLAAGALGLAVAALGGVVQVP
jgi:hypothetical protein